MSETSVNHSWSEVISPLAYMLLALFLMAVIALVDARLKCDPCLVGFYATVSNLSPVCQCLEGEVPGEYPGRKQVIPKKANK